ncbi:acyltransferase [Actinomycetospora endophytica]|uniref:Acyltransferase n=1 Tax=Actinomycetospora endophytica TaxID=2291215 RepID=A0ABS8PC28_9PSEU|nr:acyltransferase [Actinomycetospora endophytica]MCD2195783.1 acyltransferase [Actinomycetospora endophytica]
MRTARDPWTDLLRIAALGMVILYHSTFIGPQVYPQFLARHLVFAHQIGASVLLVISAHLAAGSLADPAHATLRWWFSRLARLLPGFVVGTLAATLAFDWLAPAGMYRASVGDLLANLAMLWNWNGYHHWDYVDGSYWTLPLQLAAFSLAPWLRRSRLGGGRGLRVLLWAAVLVPLAQWPLAQGAGGIYDSVVDGLGLYRWHLLVAGVATWMLGNGRLRPAQGAGLLAVCVAAHAVQNGWWSPTAGLVTDGWSVLGVGLGIVALLLAPRARGIAPPRPVAGLSARFAGISYGVYLVHQTLGYVLMLRLQEWFGAGPTVQTLAMVAQAVLLGAAMTRYVERPAHRVLLRWFDGVERASEGEGPPHRTSDDQPWPGASGVSPGSGVSGPGWSGVSPGSGVSAVAVDAGTAAGTAAGAVVLARASPVLPAASSTAAAPATTRYLVRMGGVSSRWSEGRTHRASRVGDETRMCRS